MKMTLTEKLTSHLDGRRSSNYFLEMPIVDQDKGCDVYAEMCCAVLPLAPAEETRAAGGWRQVVKLVLLVSVVCMPCELGWGPRGTPWAVSLGSGLFWIADVTFLLDVAVQCRTPITNAETGEFVDAGMALLDSYALSLRGGRTLLTDAWAAVPYSFFRTSNKAPAWAFALCAGRVAKFMVAVAGHSAHELRLDSALVHPAVSQLVQLFLLLFYFWHVFACLRVRRAGNVSDESRRRRDVDASPTNRGNAAAAGYVSDESRRRRGRDDGDSVATSRGRDVGDSVERPGEFAGTGTFR